MNEMTSGAVASVSMPLGQTQKRTQENVDVHGLKPVKNISKAKKKGPYQNSLLEGKMNKLDIEYQDFKNMSPQQFYAAYKIRKEDWYKKYKDLLPKQKGLQEEKLDEDDLIVIPGQNIKRKNGFIPHGQSRVDHEVEMALSDLYQAAKNAKKTYMMLKDRTEDEGIEGWVQEKIIKANDYLNTICEYYEHQQYSMHKDSELNEMELGAGVIAGGMANEGSDKSLDDYLDSLLDKGFGDLKKSNKKQNNNESDAWNMGYEAATYRKQPESSNPFVGKDVYKEIEWKAGWKHGDEEKQLEEVAKSKKQQRLFGMVHAVQKGDIKAPSKQVAQLAKTMPKKAAKDYASTKHKGLPKSVKE